MSKLRVIVILAICVVTSAIVGAIYNVDAVFIVTALFAGALVVVLGSKESDE